MPVKLHLILPCILLGGILAALTLLAGCGGGGSSEVFSGVTTAAISGRVVLPEAAGTQLRQATAGSYESVEVWVEQFPERRAFCDAEGYYLIDGLAPGAICNIVARWEDKALGRFYLQRTTAIEATSGSPADAGEVLLELSENRLAAVINDLYGNPIANAVYIVWGISAATDLQGNLLTPALPASVKEVIVRIAAGGFTPLQVELPIFSKDLGPLLEISLSNLQDSRRTPLLSFMPVTTTVAPGSNIDLSLFVSDPDGILPTDYAVDWSASDGVLAIAADTRSASWRAPDVDGLASVTVSIAAAGFKSSASIGFAVGGSYQVNTRVVAFSPATAAAGQTVTIKGYGFGSDAGSARVLFAGAAGSITEWSDTEIRAVVPVAAESGQLVVEIGNKVINAGLFNVIDYAVTLTPLFGPPGTIVTIEGYGFGDTQGTSSVTLHGAVLPVLKWTNTRIEAEVLHSSHSGSLALVIRDRIRPVADYVVTSITALTPDRTTRLTDGSPSMVTVSGVGFGDEQGESRVEFSAGQTGNVISWQDGKIEVEVPFAAVSGEMLLHISGKSIATPRLAVVYHDTYAVELTWSGPRLESRPLLPGVAMTSAGEILVTDFDNGWLWKLDSNGYLIERIGSPGSSDGQFKNPWGVAVDSEGNIYVTDEPDTVTVADGRLQKFDSDGNFVMALAIGGSGPAQFDMPLGIFIDASDNIYVADAANSRIQKFNRSLLFVDEWGSLGSGDGQFNMPAAVTVAADGKIYVADRDNHRIQEFAANGTFLRWYGLDQFGAIGWKAPGSGSVGTSGGSDGNPARPGEFFEPSGVCVADDGYLYVSDTGNGRLQKIDRTSGAATVIGEMGSNDGQFTEPVIILVSGTDLYVADADNSRIQILSTAGEFEQKIVPDTSSLNTYFTRVSVDRNNELIYALDRDDCSVAVFDLYGNFVRRIGSRGSGSGQLLYPDGLVINGEGNVIVADSGNARVVVFSPEGVELLRFGAYGTGYGQFRSPERVAVDADGNILVSDYLNNRVEVFSSGGDYQFSFGSQGTGNGQFAGPLGIKTTADGFIYVADSGNARVQKFSPEGIFIGWLGADETDNAGWHGVETANAGVKDSGACRFRTPTDLAIDGEDCLYVLDGEASQIQKFGPDHAREDFGHHVVTLDSAEGFVGLDLDGAGNFYTTSQDQQIRRYLPSLSQ